MSDRVLVIIDDPFELSSVGAALKLHSVDVVGEARKKSAAINLFRSMQPNVLLIDMHKTNESSIDIAIAIRKRHQLLVWLSWWHVLMSDYLEKMYRIYPVVLC